MKSYAFPLVLLFSIISAGCSDNKLACNDGDAKTKVLDVIHSHIDGTDGFDTRIKPHLGKRFISDITTLEANKELGRYKCSATYSFEWKGKMKTEDFSYDLKYIEDKKTSEAFVDVSKIRGAYMKALVFGQ